MSTTPRLRTSALARPARAEQVRPETIDAWLDTLHGLASARRAERVSLARSGTELRARLDASSR